MTPPIKTTPKHLPQRIRGWIDRLVTMTDIASADVHALLLREGYDTKVDSLRKHIARRMHRLGIERPSGRPRLPARRVDAIARAHLLSLETSLPGLVVDAVLDRMAELRSGREGGNP